MLAYCTYCSAEKNYSKTALPAIDLYKSARISKVFLAAQQVKTKFIILSGKHGIICANEKINYYDHLLLASEVVVHSELIASQIKSKGINEIVFFMKTVEEDENLKPYLDCIESACLKLKITLRISLTDLGD
jgi:hypothetical protein